MFLNGEAYDGDCATRKLFEELVTARAVTRPRPIGARTAALLHAWYLAGWLRLER